MAVRAEPGTLSSAGQPMRYAHGQHAAYVVDRCRCDPCREANSVYERERKQRVEPAYVDAGEARAYMRFLASVGVGPKQVAVLSGVSHGALAKLQYGDTRRGSAPSKRIRKATADAILAVTPAAGLDGSREDAGPVWVLLDEMINAGVPKSWIAKQLGQSGPGLQLGREFVTRRNARAIRRLHADWKACRVEAVRGDAWGNSTPIVPPVAPAPVPSGRWADPLDALAAVVELVNEGASWRRDAACRNRPPWMWFATDDVTVAKAKRICSACFVRADCLAAGMAETSGTYGGLTENERRQLIAEAV